MAGKKKTEQTQAVEPKAANNETWAAEEVQQLTDETKKGRKLYDEGFAAGQAAAAQQQPAGTQQANAGGEVAAASAASNNSEQANAGANGAGDGNGLQMVHTKVSTDTKTPISPYDFKTEADIDRYFTEQRIRQAEQDKIEDEKRVLRQMKARSLSNLGGVFSDMIKASEGALVNPRDMEKAYNALSDRQKQIYDNYRARVDALRNQLADRDKARMGAQQQREMFEARLKHDEDEAKKNRDARRREYEFTYNHGKGRPENEYFIDFGNGETKSYENHTGEGQVVFAHLYNYLKANGKIPDLEDKDGNKIEVKDQKTADYLVRQYLYSAMQDPRIRHDIYKFVTGKDDGYRAPAAPERKHYSLFSPAGVPYRPGVSKEDVDFQRRWGIANGDALEEAIKNNPERNALNKTSTGGAY